MSKRFEVSVPLVVTVDNKGNVKDAKIEGWGGYFSEAEEAAGVWDPQAGGWGHDRQAAIAQAAWEYVRGKL